MATSYVEIQGPEFGLPSALTWGGVKNEKYGGYSIPIALDTETADKIRAIAEEHGARDPVYVSTRNPTSDTMYLKSKRLSDKQKKELLGKGRCRVEVRFAVGGVYTMGDTKYLVTRVSKLRRVEDPDSDSCPED